MKVKGESYKDNEGDLSLCKMFGTWKRLKGRNIRVRRASD